MTDSATDITTTDAADSEAEDNENDNNDEGIRRKRKRKKSWMKKCMDKKWVCDDMPLWRVYMKSFVEDEEELAKSDRFKRRKPAALPKLPRSLSQEGLTPPNKCLPLSAFQLQNRTDLPNELNRDKLIRIWRNMRTEIPVHASRSEDFSEQQVSDVQDKKWPGVWPCTTRDLIKEIKEKYGNEKKKRKNKFPCETELEEEPIFDEPKENFANLKELGHARIPPICPPANKNLLVDRAVGDEPGLVDGDYIIFELASKRKGKKVYADVCLRGLKGMHLPELGSLRTRKKTWKFCFYHAVVVLLAKTQLRYKYAWSANLDYIYDHAWMLFTHIGTLNVKEKQRLDDVVVYNYKYSVELELIQELNDVPLVEDVAWDYEEVNLKRKTKLRRRDLMKIVVEIGSEKVTDEQKAPVHIGTKKIEDWFDKIPVRYANCIFRTTRFSLAFWKDGSFWYLYNPYRCNEFGYWDDDGYACILKFCSRQSLKRHLMILLLRAYVYSVPESKIQVAQGEKSPADDPKTDSEASPKDSSPADDSKADDGKKAENPDEEQASKEECYTIQIFNMIYHCCQIHNLKLLERGGPKAAQKLVPRKTIDDCTFDPLDLRDPCTIEQEDEDQLKEPIEKPTWLKLYKISWTKCSPAAEKKKTNKDVTGQAKMRWHQYTVEESNKLFSLFGEVHITDGMFEKENRGKQTYACYVVCAGMTRIMAPEYWSSKTLDVIVMCGDRYYTHSKLEAEFKSSKSEYSHINCWSRYLSNHFKIGDTMFEAKVLPAICGRLYAKSGRYLWKSLEQMFLKYQFGILACESSCLGLFKFCGSYYMCDVNSFGPPMYQYGEGAACLVRATYFSKFMTTVILMISSPECSRFSLNPVEILKVVDVGPSIFPAGRTERGERNKSNKEECPFDEEKKKQMKRWKHKRLDAGRTIDKLCCKGNE